MDGTRKWREAGQVRVRRPSAGWEAWCPRTWAESERSNQREEYLETALEQLETRMMSSISKDLRDFREFITSELGALNDRVRDLERHVEEKDCEVVVVVVPPGHRRGGDGATRLLWAA
ncbi:hypothetical protein FJT64_019800 [Amphibalanus amphitrite]|uniref:Uncharacterized protein n=1 Tax=Amphibalanus amphitrite TaxID=1232801 RepID=A0A6A4WNT2_AMPAM|nr:hypothetical protein FJT64_019800 [Amphibalanus amphitrite]